MDEYIEQFVADTKKKVNIKRRLPRIQYECYAAIIEKPFHMADTMDDALLILDCMIDVFTQRWRLYHKQDDANIAGQAMLVANAFRSADTMLSDDRNAHDILKGRR